VQVRAGAEKAQLEKSSAAVKREQEPVCGDSVGLLRRLLSALKIL
jgi:hypothetical protein